MFDPEWDKGCLGCTGYVDALGDLSMLNDRDTTFVLVSRAPLAKLEAYKALKGWGVPWVSSFGSDFNYDFHVTLDENVAPIEYNYRDKAEMEARQGPNLMEGEEHGLSVFFRVEEDVFHTYSTITGFPEAKFMWSLTAAWGGFDGMVTKDWRERTRSTEELYGDVYAAVSQVSGLRVFPRLDPPLPTPGQYDVELVLQSDAPAEQMLETTGHRPGPATMEREVPSPAQAKSAEGIA